MKVSIITCSYNNLEGLKAAVEEVRGQSFDSQSRSGVPFEVEHILIDGGSTDGTVEWLRAIRSEFRVHAASPEERSRSGFQSPEFPQTQPTASSSEVGTGVYGEPSAEASVVKPPEGGTPNVIFRWISEPDKGLYDALNKGLRMATGDVIGILHTDDVWEEGVLKRVVEAFRRSVIEENSDLSSLTPPLPEGVYSDLLYVDADDISKIKRVWRSGSYDKRKWWNGWMPPHPALFVTRELVERVGEYRLDLGSAADYEWMLRAALVHDAKLVHVNDVEEKQKGSDLKAKGVSLCHCAFSPSDPDSGENDTMHGLTPFAPFAGLTPFVRMRVGGQSNVSTQARLKANAADRKAWTLNGLKPKPWTIWLKPLRKIPQWFAKP